MSDVVIRAERLGKKYLIGHEAEQGRDVTLRDTIMRNVTRLKRSAGDLVRGRPLIVGDEVEEFWALKDVNFEIRRGEVVGIIGRNGAGKSTLLKVLSRITEPTEGRVTIEGRVASLLEVGTGFHPELSGRENIFLNGSILGMTRREIQAKFDEIVDFAGVEKFIDTPVKRYSSGMKVRLGFSVAAHLEPEILIVDEVLAVGDVLFQDKCLGKMNDVAATGRTVLFVSHNMTAIRSLCSEGVLIEAGRTKAMGEINSVIDGYMLDLFPSSREWIDTRTTKRTWSGTSKALIEGMKLAHDPSTGHLSIDLQIQPQERFDRLRVSATITRSDGEPIGSTFSNELRICAQAERISVNTVIDAALLIPGQYRLGLAIGQGDPSIGHEDYDALPPNFSFEVTPTSRNRRHQRGWQENWGAVNFHSRMQEIYDEAEG